MSRQEVMVTRYGEMRDMISCLSIYNGASPKRAKKKFTFDQAMELV